MINKKGFLTLLITNFITLALLLYSNWSVIVKLFTTLNVELINVVVTSILTIVVITITIHNNIKTNQISKKIANEQLKLQLYEQRLFIYKSFVKINTKIISNYKFKVIRADSITLDDEERKIVEGIINDSLNLYEELVIAVSLSKHLFEKEYYEYLSVIYEKYLLYSNSLKKYLSEVDPSQLSIMNLIVDEIDLLLKDEKFDDCFTKYLKFDEIK